MSLTPPDSVRETELYRNLAENGRELICQAGVTGRYLYVSPNCQRILGYEPQELIGQSFFKLVHPEDQATVNRHYLLGLITQKTVQIRFRYRHKNGDWRWLETSGQPFMGWAGRWKATLILQDITHLHQVEEQARQAADFRDSLLASTSNAVAALDRDGRFLVVNARLCELSGCHEEGLKGQDLFTMLAPEDHAPVRNALEEIVGKTRPQCRCEVGLRHQQGGERRVLLSLTPLLIEGKLTGVVVAGEDLTELRQSEEGREYLLAQLQVAQKLESIGKMSAGVAHDFNNVLAGAIATTELLRSELTDRPDLSRLLSLQQRAMVRASRLTQQLLAFSRNEEIVAGPVDLGARVRDILEFCSTQFDKRIEVHNIVSSDLPPVLGDAGQVDQMLLNLLLNAGQALVSVANEGREPRITVSAQVANLPPELAHKHSLSEHDTMLHLSIRDNGPGIPATLQAQIFDPFFTTKSPSQNHGLGLSTTHALVKNHHGAIAVESRPGHETTFHVYLPICAEEADETEQEPVVAVKNGSAPSSVRA